MTMEKRRPRRAGEVAGGLGHADDRHGRELLQRGEAWIAEAGEQDGVATAHMGGHRVERRVAGDGAGGAARDVARPEPAGDRHEVGAGQGRCGPSGLGHGGRDRGAGVGVDQEQAHRAGMSIGGERGRLSRSEMRLAIRTVARRGADRVGRLAHAVDDVVGLGRVRQSGGAKPAMSPSASPAR